jgi:hypothetical protein
MSNGRTFNTSSTYRIRVKGNLDGKWSDWFDGFTITPQADDETLLTGRVPDQAALHGLLSKIRDLGLPLLCVQRAHATAHEGKSLEVSDAPVKRAETEEHTR